MAGVTPASKTRDVSEPWNVNTVIRVHLGSSLDSLVPALGANIWSAPGDVLAPLWCVVPTMSLRSWVDQQVALLDDKASGGVTANLHTILSRDLAVEIERLALGDEWVDFGTETMALRILGALSLDHYDEALRVAETIDEIVRWRPHLLEQDSLTSLPTLVARAMTQLDLFEHGAHEQRHRVITTIQSGVVPNLPSRLSVFGLPEVMGGPRLLELLGALSTQAEVSVFLPVPDVAAAADILHGGSSHGDRGWSRDVVEALELWSTAHPEVVVHEEPVDHLPEHALGRLHRSLRSGHVDQGVLDNSVALVGAFGNERQAEQVRDVILDSIARGVEPHEVLVVSPDPGSFAVALERHWNYQRSEDDGGPRLPYELTKVKSSEEANRLGVSLALLRLVGNYATLQQIGDFLSMPAVASTLGLDFAARERLLGRARQGSLIFGVTAAQRRRFGIYELDDDSPFAEVGTWRHITDSVAVASLYPRPRPSDHLEGENTLALQPIGEPMDFADFASLQPLLRLLEQADALRPAPRLGHPGARQSLAAWLELLEGWMAVLAVQADSGDDSFERSVSRLRGSLATVTGLATIALAFEQFLELWSSLAAERSYARLHGRRGVVVAGLEDFSWARFKVVCILGLDDDKLPDAGLASAILATKPPGTSGHRPPGDPDVRRRTQGALLAAVLAASDQLIVSWNVCNEETGAAVEPAIVLTELLERVGDVTETTSGQLLDEQRALVRRHSFFDDHLRTRYDTRLRRIDDARPIRVRDFVEQHDAETAIGDLARFFRNPIGQHLRRARNVMTPAPLQTAAVLPRISLNDMTKYQFRDRFVSHAGELPAVQDILSSITSTEHFDAAFDAIAQATESLFAKLLVDPALGGDVPPLFWSSRDLKAELDLFVLNRHFDELDYLENEPPEAPAFQPIELGDFGRLVLRSSHSSKERPFIVRRQVATNDPTVLHVHPSKGSKARAVGRITEMLLELLALRVNHPDERCRVLTWYLPSTAAAYKTPPKLSSVPVGGRRLNPFFEIWATPATLPSDQAREQLANLAGIVRTSMSEMPVLFRKTSEAAAFGAYADAAGVTPWGEWNKFSFTERESIGEQEDLTSRLLFPYSFSELRRKTAFDRWAAMLGGAGRGVRWHFGAEGSRSAPVSLRKFHQGFRARAGDSAEDHASDVVRDSGEPLLSAELIEDSL